MTAMKVANKELKGMMKTVKIEDIDVCVLLFTYSSLTAYFPVYFSSLASESVPAFLICRACKTR